MNKLAKTVLLWISTAVFLLMSNLAISDPSSKTERPTVNDQSQSLSAPSSDTPQEEMARERKLENESLSSPAAGDPSTNNAPFDHEMEKSPSGSHENH